jgi:hypothetical protein
MRSLSFACILALALPAVCLSQSLAEIAAKEKERRKKNQEAGVKARVVTDRDLVAVHEEGVEEAEDAAGSVPGTSAPAAEASSSAETAQKALEAAWRRRMAQAESRRERARKRHATLSNLYLVNGQYYLDAKGRVVRITVDELQRMTAQAKAELEAAERAIETLEDEARRAGVPPGWLR